MDERELRARIQQLEDERTVRKQQMADQTKKINDTMMMVIHTIYQQSPWKPDTNPAPAVQSSPPSAKSPAVNMDKRNASFPKRAKKYPLSKNRMSELLKSAHIVETHSTVQSLAEWKINCKTNSDKTCLRLGSLEASFDRGDFCLLMKIMPGTMVEALAVKILNVSIQDDTIPGIPGCELKFKDLEGRFLKVCLDIPSHQLIAKHSYFTLAAAATKSWIPVPEYLSLVTKIKDQITEQSPEQDKIDRVKEWISANNQGLPPLTQACSTMHAVRPYLTLHACAAQANSPSAPSTPPWPPAPTPPRPPPMRRSGAAWTRFRRHILRLRPAAATRTAASATAASATAPRPPPLGRRAQRVAARPSR
jgi:hypothetical protein